MNLLSANRSVQGKHNDPSPYRTVEDQRKLVPDFGFEDRIVQDAAKNRAVAAADLFAVKAKEQAAPVEKKPSTQKSLRKLLFGKESPDGSTGAPRTAEQAELTLSSVKVIRNDLSDADLELVARPVSKSNPFSSATPLPQVAMEPTARPGFIGKLLGRIRGVGRSSE